MNKRVLLAIGATIAVLVVAIVLLRAGSDEASPHAPGNRHPYPSTGSAPTGGAPGSGDLPRPRSTGDALVEEFRTIERNCLTAYNTALRAQRENLMDETELATVIERDVLTQWRSIRARVTAASPPPDKAALYETLGKYLEARQISWEAYVAALRAPDDATSARHLEIHRQKNAEAHEHAGQLGDMFRSM